ncbi:MAG: HepT-like ribonuclease domain-containing protein [Campylobacterota bacterium]|nr:HepT-like ribonuclease domain-containing protein [Campylobacterota bacterium]
MSSGFDRLKKIYECIEDIEFILSNNDIKITHAIEDRIIKPAIRMNIVRIAEQFSKLKDDNRFQILENFTSDDLKGISSVRNYIAHDYDSTDDNIIEDVVRYNLPVFKGIIKELLKD